jgi:hypothetical protein
MQILSALFKTLLLIEIKDTELAPFL